MFELCEDLLDGIEIGAVGRQEENSCAGGADQAADARALMGAEVVEDDDVAFFECWDESLLDISDETLAVDGTRVKNGKPISPKAVGRRRPCCPFPPKGPSGWAESAGGEAYGNQTIQACRGSDRQ